MHHHGKIPPTRRIYRIDRDMSNNNISNLSDKSVVARRRPNFVKRAYKWIDERVGHLTNRWKINEDVGRRWVKKKYRCYICGNTFIKVLTTKVPPVKASCGKKCSKISYVLSKSRLQERVCKRCGKTYECYEYSTSVFCGRSCVGKNRRLSKLKRQA